MRRLRDKPRLYRSRVPRCISLRNRHHHPRVTRTCATDRTSFPQYPFPFFSSYSSSRNGNKLFSTLPSLSPPSFSCSRIHRTLEERSQRQQSSTKTGRNRGGIARGRVVKTWRMKSRRTKKVRTSLRQKERKRKREKGQRNQALLFRFSRALINYVFTAVKGGERERTAG